MLLVLFVSIFFMAKGIVKTTEKVSETEISITEDKENIPESALKDASVLSDEPELIDCSAPRYSYNGLNVLDLSLRNRMPGQKQPGMDWDSTLFYLLEDIDTNSDADNRIASYLVSNYAFINAQTGIPLQCIVYMEPESLQVNKIVTVEKQGEKYLVVDYYYGNGMVNFVYLRTVDVYVPTYATIDKTGERYYFNNDVMVRYRRIDTPRMIVQQTLNPTDTWYTNASYFVLSDAERKQYDDLEYRILNEAYNVYDAVVGRSGIIDLAGRVCASDGSALANVSVALIDVSGNSVLYSTTTAQDGTYYCTLPQARRIAICRYIWKDMRLFMSII